MSLDLILRQCLFPLKMILSLLHCMIQKKQTSPCSFIKSHLCFITVTNLPLFMLVLLSTKKRAVPGSWFGLEYV